MALTIIEAIKPILDCRIADKNASDAELQACYVEAYVAVMRVKAAVENILKGQEGGDRNGV